MANTPQKKTISNNKVYLLKDGTESISFKPNSRKPKNKTYKSLVIFKGNVDFGEEIEWLGGKPESFPTDSVSIIELIQNDSDKIYAHVFGGSSSGNEGDSGNKYTKWLVCLECQIESESYVREDDFSLWNDNGGQLVTNDIHPTMRYFNSTTTGAYTIVEFKQPMDAISALVYLNTQLVDNYNESTQDRILDAITDAGIFFHLCWSVHSPVID